MNQRTLTDDDVFDKSWQSVRRYGFSLDIIEGFCDKYLLFTENIKDKLFVADKTFISRGVANSCVIGAPGYGYFIEEYCSKVGKYKCFPNVKKEDFLNEMHYACDSAMMYFIFNISLDQGFCLCFYDMNRLNEIFSPVPNFRTTVIIRDIVKHMASF